MNNRTSIFYTYLPFLDSLLWQKDGASMGIRYTKREIETGGRMKRHIFLFSLITVICSFALYLWGLHYQQHAQLTIIGPKTAKTVRNADTSHLPESHAVHRQAGSNADLAALLQKELESTSSTYQAQTSSLTNNQQAAGISDTEQSVLKVKKFNRLGLLLGYFAARKAGKIKNNGAVKVAAADIGSGNHNLQAGMAYSYPFLLQLAIKQDNAAAQHVLLRTIGLPAIKAGLKAAHAKQTQAAGQQNLRAATSAKDLQTILIRLYRGQVFGRQMDSLALTYLQSNASSKNGGKVYQVSEGGAQAVLVDNGGSSYAWAAITDNQDANLTDLTNKLGEWYSKH